jgi:predicted amidohydrolase
MAFLLGFHLAPLQSQTDHKTRIAVIQATGLPTQDPFMGDYDESKVVPQMTAHIDKLLGLFEQAGRQNADLVCGPEDMQHIGPYGLYIETKNSGTGEILFNSLAVPIPCALTDRIASIARKYHMYIIAPLYEKAEGKVFNTAVVFDRQGTIIGTHRKTLLPIMETWLVATGDQYEVYKADFGTFAVATCWEISYPEISTIYALEGAKMIFNPTMAPDNKPGQSLSTAPMFITRARDNGVYVVPVVLGSDGNGIIDFDGNVVAEAPGKEDQVIIGEVDFQQDPRNDSPWWETLNGTGNTKAMHFLSRKPQIWNMLVNPNPPLLEQYKDIHLTTGDWERQVKAVRAVDYGPKK